MFHHLLNHLKKFDWVVFGSVLLLVGFGLAAIYSVALGSEGAAFLNFQKQCIFVAIGFVLLFAFSFFDFHSLYGLNWWVYGLGIVLLLAVLAFGETVRGTTGWFNIFGFSLQPSEIVKVILVIVLAKYFSAASYKTNQLRHLLFTGALVMAPAVLILLQPDFGSAMIVILFWLSMLAIFSFSRRQALLIILIAALLFTASFFFILKDYQKERIVTFFNPNVSSLDQGYNVAQAIIAIGAGKVFGRGLGFGSQSQLKFLPESQNDFVFAVIGEELGLVGAGLLIAFFAVLFFRLLYWVRRLDNNFGLYILLGTILLLFVEMFINIGMNTGLLPVVGISLPFVSYGGSSLIASLVLIGIVESIIINARHT